MKAFSQIETLPAFVALRARAEAGGVVSVRELNRAAQPFFVVLLRRWFPDRAIVVVTEGLKAQELFHQDVETWMRLAGGSPSGDRSEASASDPAVSGVWFYPAWEVWPHEAKLPHADVISERLETLVGLIRWARRQDRVVSAPLIVTTATALTQRTYGPRELDERTLSLGAGDRWNLLDLVERLEELHYEPEAKVTQKGEMSLRGGILDLYPLTSPWPVRLEFMGDELETLREFDPSTQISRSRIERVWVPPAGEMGLLRRAREPGRVTPLAPGDFANLSDHLPDGSIMILCAPARLEEHVGQQTAGVPRQEDCFMPWEEVRARWSGRPGVEIAIEGEDDPDLSAVEGGAARGESDPPEAEAVRPLALGFATLDAFRPMEVRTMADPQVVEAQRREFFQQLHRWMRQGHAVEVVCNNAGERQRFEEIWAEYGFRAEDATAGGMGVGLGALTRGFFHGAGRSVVVTDAEIFGRYKVQRARRLKSPHAVAVRSALDIDFTEFTEGDYVVHVQHGIGRFQGLGSMPGGRGEKAGAGLAGGRSAVEVDGTDECLIVEYAATEPGQPAPRLYVPITEAHLVSKYVGAGKARPPLNTLGGTRWAKTKAQAEAAVRDLTGELLSIQAARETQAGHAFPEDTPWQREFETSFLYEETPDQIRSIRETKRDMESAKPMDRLICGDVGFGKTEVAIRGAFKAVMSGKQVAVLVPTTILAQQHYNTFRERMADYPIRVEQLSRFRTRRQQREILEQLAAGGVDIVIGTHRLLQADVQLKDLGLVVIDEEQRFGVMHKERFKMLRRMVDVLTLSATPIPRTLYLALTGARDMSTIETPPHDRLPVETVVSPYDERLIREAIERELNREGQVYYLHNRVSDIHEVAVKIRTLVPRARVVVGHGQMESDDLEDVMRQFVDGEADVLVSTTIIESGIDIPNANTMIIDRADRFGLSDLYQLRGRVGRYKHQAFAYLLLPRHAQLLSDVRKRISAMKQYSSLGSGFKIAMRDLEIRGAGNLLGPQQSGHITAVGFELYCQLLKQSVAAHKGEKVQARVDVVLRLDFLEIGGVERLEEPSAEPAATRPGRGARARAQDDSIQVPRETATRRETPEAEPDDEGLRPREVAGLPVRYVPETRQRIEMYRKVAQLTDKAGVAALRQELRDRFGPVPPAVELLLAMAELKYVAGEKGVSVIETRGERLMLTRRGDYVMLGGKFPRLRATSAQARLTEIKRFLLGL